eukprot:1160808-Pelagomonas_calceolata.AAC.10
METARAVLAIQRANCSRAGARQCILINCPCWFVLECEPFPGMQQQFQEQQIQGQEVCMGKERWHHLVLICCYFMTGSNVGHL